MSEELNQGLMLLAVGMITVFLILFLVVFAGNLLIRIINRFVPPEQPPIRPIKSSISGKTMSAIITAVEVATGGKGKIQDIEKK